MELGPFKLSFVRMAHSIPDAVAIVIDTPAGRVLHTGDWKLDHTPVDGLKTDVGRLAELGNHRHRPSCSATRRTRSGRG